MLVSWRFFFWFFRTATLLWGRCMPHTRRKIHVNCNVSVFSLISIHFFFSLSNTDIPPFIDFFLSSPLITHTHTHSLSASLSLSIITNTLFYCITILCLSSCLFFIPLQPNHKERFLSPRSCGVVCVVGVYCESLFKPFLGFLLPRL